MAISFDNSIFTGYEIELELSHEDLSHLQYSLLLSTFSDKNVSCHGFFSSVLFKLKYDFYSSLLFNGLN